MTVHCELEERFAKRLEELELLKQISELFRRSLVADEFCEAARNRKTHYSGSTRIGTWHYLNPVRVGQLVELLTKVWEQAARDIGAL